MPSMLGVDENIENELTEDEEPSWMQISASVTMNSDWKAADCQLYAY